MIRPRGTQAPASVSAHYDDLDRFYRELWGEHLHHGLYRGGFDTRARAVLRLVDLVAERAGIEAGTGVLDVGCGYGATARYLANRLGARVTGVTLSRTQWRYATAPERAVPGVEIRRGDWLEMEVDGGAHDVVLSIESLSHMEDKDAFFRKAADALRPGGRLVVCAWLAADAPGPWQVRHLLEPICEYGRLPGLADEAECRVWLRDAGFREIAVEDLTSRVRRTWTGVIGSIARALAAKPEYWRFLLDRRQANRVFAAAVPRMWMAYRTGALRYGLFTARLPGQG